MVPELLGALHPYSRGRYFDGTIGGGGHALAILNASAPLGWLLGCDRDGAAIEAAAHRLESFSDRCELRRGNFADIGQTLAPETYDGAMLDLGVSSPQLDWPERGFSFQRAGPLDMRQDDRQTLTAADLVNGASAHELAHLFRSFGGERQAERLARAIVQERARARLCSTRQLADLIERKVARGRRRIHPATRVFQALRIAVNDELTSLAGGLEAIWRILKPGARLAILSFHSCEVRVLRAFARKHERGYEVDGPVDVPELRRWSRASLRWIQRRASTPGPSEIADNPRARSAQLRVMEKV